MSTGLRGTFIWHELMSTDLAGAGEFYRKVMGWTAAPYEGLESAYSVWMRGSDGIGGLMELPADAKAGGAPPHWMTYIGTEDAAATHAEALGLGATSLLPPREIPTVGTIAVLSDPQGAVFALHTPPREMQGKGPVPGADVFSWHDLATTDHGAAFAFYHELFGWDQVAENDMGPLGTYRTFGVGGNEWGGMFNKPAHMPGPAHWRVYVKVADIQAAAAAVSANGGRVVNGPLQVPGGHWVAQCVDPEGAMFALHRA